MDTFQKALYERGINSTDAKSAMNLMRTTAEAEGMSNVELDNRLGIQPFDTSPMQDYFVNSAKKAFGQNGENFAKEIFTLDDFASAGFDRSIISLVQNPVEEYSDKIMNMPNLTNLQKAAIGTGQIVGDLPVMIAAMIGVAYKTKKPRHAYAAGFAAPETIRHWLLDAYENGDMDTWGQFWDRFTGTAIAGMKGYVTGYSAGLTKELAGPVLKKALPGAFLPQVATTAAEIGTMVTVGSALEGRVPSKDEFIVAAITIGGLQAAGKTVTMGAKSIKSLRRKFEKTYEENDVRPLDMLEDTKMDPTIREDLNSINIDVPRAYKTAEQAARDADRRADPMAPETIEFQKQNEVWSMQDPIEAFGELNMENMMSGAKDINFLKDTYNRLLQEQGLDVLHTSERSALKRWVENSADDITRMDDLFVPLNEPLVIYHGSTTKGPNKNISGSLSPDHAFARADKNFGEIHRIVLPAGTRVALPSKTTNLKSIPNELEVVVHPENKIEVIRELDVTTAAIKELDPTIPTTEMVADPSRRTFLKQAAGAAVTAATTPLMPLSKIAPVAKKVVDSSQSISVIAGNLGESALVLPRDAIMKELTALGLKEAGASKFEATSPSEADIITYTFHPQSAVKTFGELQKSLEEGANPRSFPDADLIMYKGDQILVDRIRNNKDALAALEEGDIFESYFEPKWGSKGWEIINNFETLSFRNVQEVIDMSVGDLPLGKDAFNQQKALEYFEDSGFSFNVASKMAEQAKLMFGPKDIKEASQIEAKPTEASQIEAKPTEASQSNVQKIADTRIIRRDESTELGGRISVGEPSKPFRPYGFNEIYRDIFDDLHPLNQVVKAIKDGTDGKEILSSENPYVLARTLKGVSGVGDTFLEFGAMKYSTKKQIGESLRDIIRPIDQAGLLDAFREFAVAKRTLELHKRNIITGVDPVMAKNVIKKHGNTPSFEKDFQRLRKYQDNLLMYVRDSGLIGKEQFKAIQEANKDYVPFHRVMDPGKSSGSGLRGGKSGSLKAIRGSERPIIDPIESIIRNTYVLTTLAERNRVVNALVELAEKAPELGFLAKKKAATTVTTVTNKELKKLLEPYFKDESIKFGEEDLTLFRKKVFINDNNVIRYKDGKPEVYEADPLIIEAFGAMDREALSMAVKILALPASALRTGAVLSPDFMARNATRDTVMAYLFSKEGFIPVIDTFIGMGHVLGRSKAYQEWVANGGQFSHLQSIDRNYHQKNMKELLQSIPVRNVLRNPIEQLRALSGLIEQSTRVQVFAKTAKKARKQGLSDLEATTRAAFEARDVTLDFQRMGAKIKSVNAIAAFFNAFLQAPDKMVRFMKDNPKAFAMRAFAGLMVPSATLYLLNRDEEWYKQTPQWEKDIYWHIEIGNSDNPAKNIIYRMPKPFGPGLIVGTGTEKFIEYMIETDPKGGQKFLQALGKEFVPNLMPQALSVPLEIWANKSFFLNRPIIPRDREKVLPEYQYGTYTTETAKVIAALVGQLPGLGDSPLASPAVIEHIVKGWTGGLGKYVLDATDELLLAAGLSPEVNEPTPAYLTNIPLVKAFITRYPSMNTATIENFYDEYEDREKYINSVKALLAEGRYEEGKNVLETAVEAGKLVRLTGYKNAISGLSKTIRNIHQLPRMEGMSDKELSNWKREQIDKLYLDVNRIAKLGLRLIKTID